MAEGSESEPSLHHGAHFPSSPDRHGSQNLLRGSPVAQEERPPLGSAPAATTKHHGPGALNKVKGSPTGFLVWAPSLGPSALCPSCSSEREGAPPSRLFPKGLTPV